MRPLLPPRLLDLRSALREASEGPYGYALYLPEDEPWTLDTRCALVDANDPSADDTLGPAFAQAHRLRFALDYRMVRGIRNNLMQQVASPSDLLLLEAFLYYYDNDAFLRVGGTPRP